MTPEEKYNEVVKAGEPKYNAVHMWLTYNFGSPPKCEMCDKVGCKYEKSGRWNIQWALVTGKDYVENRDNFIGLCVKCHSKYDRVLPEKCSIDGCDKKYHCKNLCHKHYRVWWYQDKRRKLGKIKFEKLPKEKPFRLSGNDFTIYKIDGKTNVIWVWFRDLQSFLGMTPPHMINGFLKRIESRDFILVDKLPTLHNNNEQN